MHSRALGMFGGVGLGARAGVALGSHGVRNIAAFASVAAIGGSVAYLQSYPKAIPRKDPATQRLVLERPLMEAICGALGEVAQICILYPLETIKVKCQTDGLGAVAVLQQVLRGGLPSAGRQLYAGFFSAAACCMLVGAVHYASFCASKRVALQAEAAASSSSSSSSSSQGPQQGDSHQSGSGGANMFAAVMGALATALVESPCELFRHQAQAGMVSGNFLGEMAKAVRTGGPGALYWGFVPFCLESFPYDIAELGVYSQLRDVREATAKRNDDHGKWVASVPDHVWDLSFGAAAGVTAVLVSMPFDCIKTYMQTHGAELVTKAGPMGQAAAFVAVGSKLVRQAGPGALFVGMAPRLVQQVPSTTICWWAIEQCRALLEPYTKP